MNQEKMKATNKILKSKKMTEAEKKESLAEIGITESGYYSLLRPDYAGRIGFPSYSLTNNNANIRRLKKEILFLEEKADRGNTEEMNEVCKIVRNSEVDRIQLIFDGKPEAEVRTILKSNGFRWSPRFTAWQRHLNNNGERAALRAMDAIKNLAA